MRLTKIKLAGFKSFVDPTSLPLPSNLIGIVGPNGCGKSNVIDAVRWVMGESSAKHLRGESMADVIFNGSSARQPVGQAGIELTFDNSAGTLGGEYAAYSEITVRREVTRDGNSTYFLNSTRCRRKDVVDIFLGTGLGPRSYSIIEQGMISRVVEAKPDDLRVYFEEAAGISKYKERRRETENRIRHTRENLARLADLREELGKQLEKLDRQAKAAERYKILREEERQLKAQTQVLQWQLLKDELSQYESGIREQQNRVEAAVATQRHIDAEMEKYREIQLDRNDQFNTTQGQYYALNSDISRVEQTMTHHKERAHQYETDLTELLTMEQSLLAGIATDQAREESLLASIAASTPALSAVQTQYQMQQAALETLEQQSKEWQQQWDHFNHKASSTKQQAEVGQTRLQHIEQRLLEVDRRSTRLQEEQAGIQTDVLQITITGLQTQKTELAGQKENLQQKIADLLRVLKEKKDTIQSVNQQIQQTRQQLQILQGQLISLQALQEAALGKSSKGTMEWLEGVGLAQAARLAEKLQVTTGWETAVETVLGDYLEAVGVQGFDTLVVALDRLSEGRVHFFDCTASTRESAEWGLLTETLASKIQSAWPLPSWLQGVYVVEDLSAAMALLPRLSVKESIVTRQGIWLGKDWLRVTKEKAAKSGVIVREQEIQQKQEEIKALSEILNTIEDQLHTVQAVFAATETERDVQQQHYQTLLAQLADTQAKLQVEQNRLSQLEGRVKQISKELTEQLTQKEQLLQEQHDIRVRWEAALADMGQHETQRQTLQAERERIQQMLATARQTVQRLQQEEQGLRIHLQGAQTELQAKKESLIRWEKQQADLKVRKESLQKQIAETRAPLETMGRDLESLLEKQLSIENALGAARLALEEVESTMRDLTQQRTDSEHTLEKHRTELEKRRLLWQEIQVRAKTVVEQLQEAGFELEAVQTGLPEDANLPVWQEEIGKVANRIHRLGPINLSAIEELRDLSERKTHLDAQNEDLEKALNTLETAIRKIDQETKTRFKETFDQVNEEFKRLFPRLFGGGNAYLELTEDDLLSTGVNVIARPPGKRNSTIHLLSGGEKALTAVALVFAIFHLNPSPFCMLDEVDAPLDDANVGRFCNLVREMSASVQFIFISHNKLTIEMANHLMGVTMNEPGVSRLVAVDVQEAMALTEA